MLAAGNEPDFLGGYANPMTGRCFHIDSVPVQYRRGTEYPHVDVNRAREFKGPLKERKYPSARRSMTTERLLTFELSSDGARLDVHMNREGAVDLVRYIEALLVRSADAPVHDHLMTPSWAGKELSEEVQGPDSTLLNKVTLRLWP